MKAIINTESHQHGNHKHYPSTTRTVDVELVKENCKTVLVKLADGNVIKRHRNKGMIEE